MPFTQVETVARRLERYVSALRLAFPEGEAVIARDLAHERARYQTSVPGFLDAARHAQPSGRESYPVFTDGIVEWKISPCLAHDGKKVGILIAKYRRPRDVLQARVMPRAGMHMFLVTNDVACAQTHPELFAERSGAKYEFETFGSIEDYVGWLEREVPL